MEHHHFNQTVTILQHEGHNIFKSLTADEFKWVSTHKDDQHAPICTLKVLGNIKHCILATDLALFFGNKSKLNKIVQDGLFNWENETHRWGILCMQV